LAPSGWAERWSAGGQSAIVCGASLGQSAIDWGNVVQFRAAASLSCSAPTLPVARAQFQFIFSWLVSDSDVFKGGMGPVGVGKKFEKKKKLFNDNNWINSLKKSGILRILCCEQCTSRGDTCLNRPGNSAVSSTQTLKPL